ncbi:unnamed protein product [Macrosiphum euphorbiae]|uniref:Uncharacterized protein n=1 Tax=Macrosiphum euphorbiae TaxID=13131 RepID=A0AAV0VZD7_9HEMI|nr:unnamed protein product [Macrosiphum euphorbiae]
MVVLYTVGRRALRQRRSQCRLAGRTKLSPDGVLADATSGKFADGFLIHTSNHNIPTNVIAGGRKCGRFVVVVRRQPVSATGRADFAYTAKSGDTNIFFNLSLFT